MWNLWSLTLPYQLYFDNFWAGLDDSSDTNVTDPSVEQFRLNIIKAHRAISNKIFFKSIYKKYIKCLNNKLLSILILKQK